MEHDAQRIKKGKQNRPNDREGMKNPEIAEKIERVGKHQHVNPKRQHKKLPRRAFVLEVKQKQKDIKHPCRTQPKPERK